MAKKKQPISGFDYVMPKPDAETIRKSIVYKLIFILGVDPKEATEHQWLNAAMLAARPDCGRLPANPPRPHRQRQTHGLLPFHGIPVGTRLRERFD